MEEKLSQVKADHSNGEIVTTLGRKKWHNPDQGW
jgi:hypothetical protein